MRSTMGQRLWERWVRICSQYPWQFVVVNWLLWWAVWHPRAEVSFAGLVLVVAIVGLAWQYDHQDPPSKRLRQVINIITLVGGIYALEVMNIRYWRK